MKKLGFLLLTLCLRFSASGQVNLVPNGGFENNINCNLAYIYGALPPWDSPTDGSPDAFNTCGIQFSSNGVPNNNVAYQNPHSGNGYVGGVFFQDETFREYMQVELDRALIGNKKYCVSFYINLADKLNKATNNIGMYFSNTHTYISNTNPLYLSPQINDTNIVSDTLGWTLISGNFVAQGGERYIIIGIFFLDTLCDTLNLTGIYNGAYYFLDDVDVHYCDPSSVDELSNNVNFEISPNPATIEIKITTTNAVMKEAHIYTTMGQCTLQSTINNRQSTIDISALPAGMYIAEVISEKGVIRKRFVKQ